MTFEIRGSLFRSFGRFASPNTDQRIREWQRQWRRGADARWSGLAADTNPNPPGSDRSAAWSAGWSWAEHHPDRRLTSQSRLAHPHRRVTDTFPRLMRHARTGAIGVSALTVFGGLWAIRRHRSRGDKD
jgi:hypothetical protein